jgi:hypothetical protein
MLYAAVLIFGLTLGNWIGRRARPPETVVRNYTKCSQSGCQNKLDMCDEHAVRYRFRYVSWPPEEVMLHEDGAPHPYNDCGNCIKYVRAEHNT